jgi:hypothetical protein
MPEVSWIFRPAFVGELHCFFEYVLEDMPMNLHSRFGDSAMVDGMCVRPEATSPGSTKEFPGLHLNPFSLSAGDHGEDEDKKLVERQFPVSRKMLGCQLPGRIDLSGNNLKNFFQKSVNLA